MRGKIVTHVVMAAVAPLVLTGCQSPFAAPAIDQVEKHGGFVSWQWSPEQVTFYSPSRSHQIDDQEFAEVLPYLRMLPDLKILDLTGTNVTDQSMPRVAGLSALRQIYLAATPVTPAGVGLLKPLSSLRYVTVPMERFNDEDMRVLQADMPTVQFRRIDVAQSQRVR